MESCDKPCTLAACPFSRGALIPRSELPLNLSAGVHYIFLDAASTEDCELKETSELYQAMRRLAAFPAEPEGGRLSIFDPIPANRTCREAGVPPVYCACLRNPGWDAAGR